MSLDETMLADACTQIKEEYSIRARSLNYANFQVSYVRPSVENDENKNQQNKIYVMAEFYRPLFEKREDRAKLRHLIPKKWEYNGETIQVVLEYVKLPRKIRTQLSEARKYREKN